MEWSLSRGWGDKQGDEKRGRGGEGGISGKTPARARGKKAGALSTRGFDLLLPSQAFKNHRSKPVYIEVRLGGSGVKRARIKNEAGVPNRALALGATGNMAPNGRRRRGIETPLDPSGQKHFVRMPLLCSRLVWKLFHACCSPVLVAGLGAQSPPLVSQARPTNGLSPLYTGGGVPFYRALELVFREKKKRIRWA
jgi:hypothetical protein